MLDGYGAIIDEGQDRYDPPQLPDQTPAPRKLSLRSADLYSYHRFAAGPLVVGDFPVFLTPIGQAGQGFAVALTELQTNIRVSGLLPGGVAWRIQQVGVEFAPGCDADDVINFCRHTFLDFIRGSDRQTLGPVRFFPGGAGVTGVATTTLPVTDLREVSNGVGSYMAMRDLDDVPIELPPSEQFSFEFRVRNNNAGGPADLNAELIVGVRLVGKKTEATQI